MLFGFLKTPETNEDDIATGTYADGAVGTLLYDPSARPGERGQTFRRNAHERDYGAARTVRQAGFGMVP